jgi:hypothetical protein
MDFIRKEQQVLYVIVQYLQVEYRSQYRRLNAIISGTNKDIQSKDIQR